MLALVACSALLAVGSDSPPTVDVSQAYQEAKAKVGRSPEEQVKLALWCESHGLTTQKLHHLTLAILADPKNVAARGLMGLVAYNGRWLRPEAVAEKFKTDPERLANLAEYEAKRLKAPYTADAQWALGVWADEHGLKEQAKAHLTAVIRLDPKRELAWKKLGYRKHEGRWITDAQLSAEKAEAEAQKVADRKWKPLLEKSKAMLDQPSKREEAEAALANVTDPRAVRSVWVVFVTKNDVTQAIAVRLLGQIEGLPASRALADLAIRGATPNVRRAATETLKHRDPREFVGLFVALIRKPLKYEVRPLNGPQSPGILFVEGERYNIRRFYVQPPPAANMYLPRLFSDDMPFNPSAGQLNSLGLGIPGLTTGGVMGNLMNNPVVMAERRDAQIANAVLANQANAMVVQRQLAEDIAVVDSMNESIRATNDRVLPVLKDLTGQEYGDDPSAWQRYQLDQAGYAFLASSTSEKPTYDSVVNIPGISSGHSCFAAGTMVRTIEGDRPIETVRAGDLVLVQDTKTGSLGYQSVVVAVHNPPNATLKIRLGGSEAVVATGIHRFWKAGQGWTMARDLKAGDPIRTLGGVATVEAVEDDRVQPVFNLEVGEGHSFLVGKLGALVHDNSLVEATPDPFDGAAKSAK
jgi:hypothetical protein